MSNRSHVLVIGDAILDHRRSVVYQRPSPESPGCPVATEEETSYDLGGAANAARWIAGLGDAGEVTLHCHFPSHWEHAKRLYTCLRTARVELGQHLLRNRGCGTLKERIYLHYSEERPMQQMIRIDRDTDIALSQDESDHLCERLAADIERSGAPAAIVVADYGKGMFTGEPGRMLIERINSFSAFRQIPVFVNAKDPSRWRNFEADFLICNESESRALGPVTLPMLGCRHLIVTRAEHGVRAFVLGGAAWATLQVTAPAPCERALDVTGAGDAFLAGLASHLVTIGFRHGTVLDEERLARALTAAQDTAATCVLQMGCGEPRRR